MPIAYSYHPSTLFFLRAQASHHARINSRAVYPMIEVNERIEVPSTPKAVWAILSDPSAVVECVEGAALGERDGLGLGGAPRDAER